MTGALQHIDDDAGARCFRCGAIAAGPCASCHEPVCGGCYGTSFSGAWPGLLLWLAAIFVGLAAVTWILGKAVG